MYSYLLYALVHVVFLGILFINNNAIKSAYKRYILHVLNLRRDIIGPNILQRHQNGPSLITLCVLPEPIYIFFLFDFSCMPRKYRNFVLYFNKFN